MPSSKEMRELEKIDAEMSHVALQQQQLTDRKDILSSLEAFRKHSGPRPDGQLRRADSEDAETSSEILVIEEQLEMLARKKQELQEKKDKILYPKSQEGPVLQHVDIITKGGVFVLPPMTEPAIVPPPPRKAPQVILNPTDLPNVPANTQCPFCHQFITTETIARVGSATWLVCAMSTVLCCVVGCCLIPFCTTCSKDIEHRCPKCRAKIHTVPRL
ncbi:hypothetical protein JZ751_022398 [Albula glossodonta]|uniref:LITAF domain-containing protein n=1 Tax=Albula glossodonta TaxID=121402 RepID=A0A8T2MVB9_9TELE|nr:hypothetical protein JZ751_028537 [Albula glossodonta]KAG9330695.1 hypothetical protein JZ751_022398 [Albula glossodonta]